jgi:acetylornithine deacetylase/succinyl-diaminopimelate desuccinylase-like protein
LDSSRPLVISAHTDTVFPVNTDLTLQYAPGKLSGPGIGDNSLGVAGLFGLLWSLSARRAGSPGFIPTHDIWFVANVGEEGMGDLCGMRAVVDRFGGDVTAYLILEGMALGQIYHRALGVQRFRITACTEGGHSWVDYGRPSAIHELAALVFQLTSLALPRQPRTTLNVGVISGGTTVNTIAAEASLELDLRSEGERALISLVERVQALVAAANRPGVSVKAENVGNRPAGNLPADHPLVLLAMRCLKTQGISPHLSIGSTDANIPLNRGFPAVCIGLTAGHGAHTLKEYINTEPLAAGMAQLLALVEGVLQGW